MELSNTNKKYFGLSLTTWILIIVVLVLLICKTSEAFSSTNINYSNTEINNNESYSSNTTQQINIYNFYTNWCGYSQQFLPQWNTFKESHKDDPNVNCVSLNCDNPDENTQKLLQKYNIQGYPTVIFAKGEEHIQYSDERTVEALEVQLNKLL